MLRPSWDEYFLNIATAVAARADCSRRQAGAVVVRDRRIVATGYNGAAAGRPGCLQGHCPRGRHFPAEVDGTPSYGRETARCGCGHDWPCPDAVQPVSTSYDTGVGVCIAIHAEGNALLYCDGEKSRGATIYVTGEPCAGCSKLIEGAGIVSAIWPDGRMDFMLH